MAQTMFPDGNMSLVCTDPTKITAKGVIWLHENPLIYSLPLLLLQISLISVVYRTLFACLKPLGQTTVVAQILSGLVLGPSLIGHDRVAGSTLFPARGSMMLETAATFGIVFFLFGVGVKMDADMMVQPGKKAIIIGVSLFFFTLTIPMAVTLILTQSLEMEKNLVDSLPYIAASQSLTSFPVIGCLLTELNILNTDLGRLAVSSAMFCDFIGIALTAFGFAILENKEGPPIASLLAICSSILFVICVVFILRPLAFWVQRNTKFGRRVNDGYMCTVFLIVMIIAFFSELIGQHYSFGPFMLGFVMPDGPPLGAAMVMKLELFIDGILYPAYSAISGLNTDSFKIHFQATWIVAFVISLSCLVKIGAVMVPAMYNRMPLNDAFVLGLILNAKGIIEIIVYNLWRKNKILRDETYALSIWSVVIVTGVVTPLIKMLYDPSSQYVSLRRSTIQHTKPDAELRILVCVHKQETTPAIINLLEVSNPTQQSPITVIALVLVELVGRSTPVLIAHKPERALTSNVSFSSRIINAFQGFQSHNEGRVRVHSFTSISHFKTIHDDICHLSLDKKANIVIVPFHKEWAIDGTVGSVNRAIQQMNINVLEKAPCSVGILVDRGSSESSMSLLTTRTLYRVAAIFIGGADDMEALAYGSRMAGHQCADVTLIRFLLFGSENSKERKHDSNLIENYRRLNAGNPRFDYVEKLVRDGVGLGAAIRELENCFDLILVGKNHEESPMIAGLEQWSECIELGVVGDILASPDLNSKVSVLVVQQQKTGGNFMSRAMQAAVNDRDRDQLVNDFESAQSSSVTISRQPSGSWTVPIGH